MDMRFYCFHLFCNSKFLFTHKNTPHRVVSKFLLFRVSILWGAVHTHFAAVVFIFMLSVFAEWIAFAKDPAQLFVILAAFHAVQQGFGGFGCI